MILRQSLIVESYRIILPKELHNFGKELHNSYLRGIGSGRTWLEGLYNGQAFPGLTTIGT
jgi:hypothetical protein